MFRRNKKADPEMPKPPTKEEILSDLKTFHIIRPVRERNHDTTETDAQKQDNVSLASNTSTVTTPATSPNVVDDAEWWAQFENFLADIEELKNYRQYLQFKKADLIDLDRFISKESDDIHNKLRDHIEETKRMLANNQ